MELQDIQGMYIKLDHSTFQLFPSIATSPYPLINFVDKLIQMGSKTTTMILFWIHHLHTNLSMCNEMSVDQNGNIMSQNLNLLLWVDFFFPCDTHFSFSFFLSTSKINFRLYKPFHIAFDGCKKKPWGHLKGCSSWVGYLGQHVICNINVSYMDKILISKRWCQKSLALKLWGKVGRTFFATCKQFCISIVQLWYLSGFVFVGLKNVITTFNKNITMYFQVLKLI